MFLVRKPSAALIDRFLRDSETLPLSYEPVGVVREPGQRRGIDEHVVRIGSGAADFGRACDALAAWQQFNIGWVERFPRGAATAVGTVVAVAVRHLGFWSLNGARVVYHVGGEHDRRFGYAYGTLPNHAESGEELFEVFVDPQTEDVMYRIRATARAQTMLARIGEPFVRLLQRRFRRDSAAAMRRAVATHQTRPT